MQCKRYRGKMKEFIENLKSYLQSVLNTSVNVHPWKNTGNLPFFLLDSYDFYNLSIFDLSCLLMIPKGTIELTPGVISNHYKQAQKHWNGFVIHAQACLSSYNRKRLIDHGIPFVIPGNQMYLPHLGIDLREHFRKSQDTKIRTFTPATQAVVIYALTRQEDEHLRSTLLAEKLSYTLMTINRAFAELKAAQIGQFCQEGRERWWNFSDKQALWSEAIPFLRSPVKKRIWLKNYHPKLMAGLTALSHLSLLTAPEPSVFAMSTNQWETSKQSNLEEVPLAEDADVELEIWHYDPDLFAKDDLVDPFSLYLSLKALQDERVESALQELMEKITC